MNYLLFPIDGVIKILEHSKRNPLFSPTFSQLYDGRYRKDGKDIEIGADVRVSADDVELTKVEEHFLLVHDDGIYIMAGTEERLKGEEKANFVVHCDGCNPAIDEDWWTTSRQLVGGNDFGEALPLQWLERAVKNAEALEIDRMIIGVQHDSMSLIEGLKP